MSIIENKRFSQEIANKLHNMFVHTEGSLFQGNKKEMIIQTDFLTKIIESVNPKFVLETGTQKAKFDYFCKVLIPEVNIVTFGIDKPSQKCVDFLNEEFGNYIEFICGDSKKTLTDYNTEKEIDFAWVDGGHDYKTCKSDLVNCDRLKVKHICIDDYNMLVKKPVHDFVEDSKNYTIEDSTKDSRGICYLKRI